MSKRSLYHYDSQEKTIECQVRFLEFEGDMILSLCGYIEDEQAKKDYNRFIFNLWLEKEHLQNLYNILHVAVNAREELLDTIEGAFQGRQAYFKFQRFLQQHSIVFYSTCNWYWRQAEDVTKAPRMKDPERRTLFNYQVDDCRQSAVCLIDDGLYINGTDTDPGGQTKRFRFYLEIEQDGLVKLYDVLGVPQGQKQQLADVLVQRFDRMNGWYHWQEFLVRHCIPHNVYSLVGEEVKV